MTFPPSALINSEPVSFTFLFFLFITLYYKQTIKQTITIWQGAFIVWFLQTKKVWTIRIIMSRVQEWAGETFRCVGIWSDSQLPHKVPMARTTPQERCRAVRSFCKITVISGSSHYNFLYHISSHLVTKCGKLKRLNKWIKDILINLLRCSEAFGKRKTWRQNHFVWVCVSFTIRICTVRAIHPCLIIFFIRAELSWMNFMTTAFFHTFQSIRALITIQGTCARTGTL